jgi:CDP-diacylglycerol pyrophosphatase
MRAPDSNTDAARFRGRKLVRRAALKAGFAISVVIVSIGIYMLLHSRETLWRIVNTNCVPAAMAGQVSRCAEVLIAKGVHAGHVVFKDRNGALQYLLMPTKRVYGIEDPQLLAGDSPNYWASAWRARRWMELSNGATVPRDAVSITVNSAWARSQNQLHFHISCVRADLHTYLNGQHFNEQWATLPGGWQGHPYEVKRVIAETLDGIKPFEDIAQGHADEMGRQAIAVIGATFEEQHGFWILKTRMAPLQGWLGAIEGDVQDHGCAVLKTGFTQNVKS